MQATHSIAAGLVLTSSCAIAGCANANPAQTAHAHGAPVTLTSAAAGDVDEGNVGWTTRPTPSSSDADLRRIAAWKSRCEATNDDDACAMVSRSRMR